MNINKTNIELKENRIPSKTEQIDSDVWFKYDHI